MRKKLVAEMVVLSARVEFDGHEFGLLKSITKKMINRDYNFTREELTVMTEICRVDSLDSLEETPEQAAKKQEIVDASKSFINHKAIAKAYIAKAKNKVCKARPARGSAPCMSCVFEKCSFYKIDKEEIPALYAKANTILQDDKE